MSTQKQVKDLTEGEIEAALDELDWDRRKRSGREAMYRGRGTGVIKSPYGPLDAGSSYDDPEALPKGRC